MNSKKKKKERRYRKYWSSDARIAIVRYNTRGSVLFSRQYFALTLFSFFPPDSSGAVFIFINRHFFGNKIPSNLHRIFVKHAFWVIQYTHHTQPSTLRICPCLFSSLHPHSPLTHARGTFEHPIASGPYVLKTQIKTRWLITTTGALFASL